MDNKIVTFETNEFEIAIVTYNRCEFIEAWLTYCYVQIKKRNIGLSIYDSSTNNDTEEYINNFISMHNDKIIQYYHINSSVNIGYKPMFPILKSKSKYIWVSGDSRCHDFKYLDEKVFPYLKQDIDYAVFHVVNNEENDGKVYTDRDELLKDCFLSMTCIGLSIYKTSLFDPIKYDNNMKHECDKRFKENYAFAWIGYFLEMFSLGQYNALFSIIPIKNIKSDIKVQSWFNRCLGCWIEDLCDLMEKVSGKYKYTELVLKDTWKYMSFDSPEFYKNVWEKGDLNKETYKKYQDNGMLKKVNQQTEMMKMFADITNKEIKKCFNQALNLEEKQFREICLKHIKKIGEIEKIYKLWIYGAGKGGKILLDYLQKYHIHVCGFIDENADKINYINGIPVRLIGDVNLENSFIIVSLIHWKPFIIKTLLNYGVVREHIFYIIIDNK